MSSLKTVLLIDDDDISNFLVSRILQRAGVCDSVMVARNGEEGLIKVQDCVTERSKLPDLILLDMNMPVISGEEFLKKLHLLNLSLETSCIITISNIYKETQKEELSKLGVHAFMTKPFTREKLLQALL